MKLSLRLAVTSLLFAILLGISNDASPVKAQSPNTLPTCPTDGADWIELVASPFFDEDQTLFLPYFSGVLWRSTDGGASWQVVYQVPSGHGIQILRIAPVRSAAGLSVYLGYDEISNPDPPQYFTYSADGGQTWEEPWLLQLTNVCLREGVTNEPGVLFSSCSTDWPLQGDPSIDGIHRSVDYGRTWERVWAEGRAVWDVIPSPDYNNDHSVFAVRSDIYPDANPYPMVSTDSGTTWHDLAFGLCPLQSNANINNIFVSPGFTEDRTIFGITRNDHLLKSADGGLTWQNIYPRDVPTCEQPVDLIIEVDLSPNYAIDRTIFMRTYSGAYVSYDDGGRWHALPGQNGIRSIQVRRRPEPAHHPVYLPLLLRKPAQAATPHHRQYLPLITGFDDSPHPVPLTLIGYIGDGLDIYYRSDDGGLNWGCLNLPPS